MMPIIAAFTSTLVLMGPTMAVARRIGAVAHPRPDRWGHRQVPRIGGLPMAAGLGMATAVAPLADPDRFVLLIGLVVMASLGLADDLLGVSPAHRLSVEVALGAALVGAAWSGLGWLTFFAAGIALLAVPLVVNATNLVDSADGVAAAVSALTGLGLAALAALVGNGALAAIALAVPAAAIPFLGLNVPPARVFMGDVGSLSLGIFLACLTALVAREAVVSEPIRFEVLAALPLMWALHLGDLVMVVLTRLRRGVSPIRGGVDHTSHRLMRAGLTPRTMLAALVGLAALCVLAGVMGSLSGSVTVSAIVTLMTLLMVGAFEVVIGTRVPHE